jgi:hypothetical protein
VADRGALRKPSTRSRWAAIELSSQLQERIINIAPTYFRRNKIYNMLESNATVRTIAYSYIKIQCDYRRNSIALFWTAFSSCDWGKIIISQLHIAREYTCTRHDTKHQYTTYKILQTKLLLKYYNEELNVAKIDQLKGIKYNQTQHTPYRQQRQSYIAETTWWRIRHFLFCFGL